MALWKLTPAAFPSDAAWQDRRIWQEVIVEAPSAAFARQYAADWELAEGTPHVGNETPSPESGLLDEKLYRVRQVPSEEAMHVPAATGTAPVRQAVPLPRPAES